VLPAAARRRPEAGEGENAMTPTDRSDTPPTPAPAWGSDAIAALLRAMDVEFIALTPGASFRGLHDSLVNYLGNTRPELLLALHEESAVAIAHGYARVTGRPMAVALHSNVGLMHATMAIFNAWCDRVPILLLGAVGPMDAVRRRPWVDWIHTARDLGALVRGYVKWDDVPGSVPAALEAILRARVIATTPPAGPVYVCLDAGLQEDPVDGPVELPPLARFGAGEPADPPPRALARAAALLAAARRPVMLVGRVSTDPGDWDRRVALAERLGARVFTDLKTGASFPTRHPLHGCPPGLFLAAEAWPAIREADVVLSLDWIDLAGTLRLAGEGAWPRAAVVQCSVDQYVHNGWSMDHQGLPPADVPLLATPDRVVARLLEAIPPRPGVTPPRAPEPVPRPEEVRVAAGPGETITMAGLAERCTSVLADHDPSYVRLPLGWPGEYCRFAHPLDYVGFDGGGGLGSGPGMAVGAALALRGTGRLPVAILGDGDYLMGVTALWTGVHHGAAALVVVANNRSFLNDELHQERVARLRERPVENRGIGVRIGDPPIDLAALARGQGALGLGPVRDEAELAAALKEGIAHVRRGALCVIDVHVAAEYSRATSSAVLRQVPTRR
jgi:thiamine pyrophosphate-dependent acetolactate synthase large subunit-like protein